MGSLSHGRIQTLRGWIFAIFLCVIVIMVLQTGFAWYTIDTLQSKLETLEAQTIVQPATHAFSVIVGLCACGLLLAIIGGRFLLSGFVAPLHQSIEFLRNIADGNFLKPCHVTRTDEIGQLQTVVNQLVEKLIWITEDIHMLTTAGASGALSSRADLSRHTGEFARIVQGVNTILDAVMKPLNIVTGYMDRIAKGDLPNRITDEYYGDFHNMIEALNVLIDAMNEVTWLAVMIAGGNLDVDAKERSEQDRLMKALNKMIQQLNAIMHESKGLSQAVQDGKLDMRIAPDEFTGGWRSLVTGMNNVLDAFAPPFTMAASYIDRIAQGDIPQPIDEEYQGDFNKIKQNLNLLIKAMHDITRVAEAIADGSLNIEIRQRSEQDRLMNALNVMVNRLAAILQEMDRLIRSIQEGQLDVRGKAESFEGGWRELVVGINNVITAFVAPINVTAEYLDHISKGDIPKKITEEYNGDFNEIKVNLNMLIDTMHAITHLAEEIASGSLNVEIKKRSEQDRLMKALTGMVTSLNTMVSEMNGLVQAVQEGRLDVRGNAEVFEGGWQELVIGMNHVIDAFVAPITMAASVIDRIAKGDVPDLIEEGYQGDFNQIKTNLNLLIDATNEVAYLAEAMANGNLMLEVNERSPHDTLMQALNTMIQRMKEIVSYVQEAATHVANHSQDLNSTAESLSQGASQQAAAAEEVSSSMEQMTANIAQSADNARQTEQIAIQSSEYAEEGGKVVAETVLAMQQIAEKILVIEDIATQTRLLSLNATIEAARAHEHGKAFSVVATEVRKLSDITKKAAEEISKLATSSLIVSKRAGEMLITLLPSSHKTAELVQEITAASHEQSVGAGHVNLAIQQLDQVIQQNASTIEELATAAGQLAHEARQLQNTVSFFKVSQADGYFHEKKEYPQITSKTMPKIPHKPDKGNQNYAPEIGLDAKESPSETQKGKDDSAKKNDGTVISMNVQEGEMDEKDAEFERY